MDADYDGFDPFLHALITQVLSRLKPIIAKFQLNGEIMEMPVERAIMRGLPIRITNAKKLPRFRLA